MPERRQAPAAPGHLVRPAVRGTPGAPPLPTSRSAATKTAAAFARGFTSPELMDARPDRPYHARPNDRRAGRRRRSRETAAGVRTISIPRSSFPSSGSICCSTRAPARTACSSRPTATTATFSEATLNGRRLSSTWTEQSPGGIRMARGPSPRRTPDLDLHDLRHTGRPGRRRGRQHGRTDASPRTQHACDGDAVSAQPPRAGRWASGSPRVPCLGPAAPAALLEQLHEPMGDRHRVEEDRVEELRELVGHLLVVALPSLGIGGLEKARRAGPSRPPVAGRRPPSRSPRRGRGRARRVAGSSSCCCFIFM